ncbi:WecB/TagA/CpsF family glycosyltransferase [Thalassotalea euphylliae]|uniref:WecB/TagA/CpsF family glycosyltransferase n=1 Tax=Thalassotalea euphylliae TaxID=1655234 RepID=A0A3E0UHT0_9GAMM|nr:WecB/TagA/CpsF family glycosyltransferase [Thalassotalea euphylliae]REL36558.1 WecB/TagA/CpsF family glycosyltransferase [Thalassotalea euphylliae]
MKILFCHNFYQQLGGEETVVKSEIKLLQQYGHQVELFSADSKNIRSLIDKISLALNLSYSKEYKDKLKNKLKTFSPDMVHVHNVFPLLTVSIFDACQEAGVPVVATLHNYRYLCPSATLFIDGKFNFQSIIFTPYLQVKHRVYRDSYLATFLLARVIARIRKKRVLETKVDGLIAVSSTVKKLYQQAGVPSNRIYVKPNFVQSKGDLESELCGNYAIYCGRLSIEKGVNTLIKAWRSTDIELRILGTGPLEAELRKNALPNIKFMGYVEQEVALKEISQSKFLIVPSECFESFGLSIIEAYSCGIPVVASNVGAHTELVHHGKNGLLFNAGNISELQVQISRICSNEKERKLFGSEALRLFNSKFRPESNYLQLLKIYNEVTQRTIEKPLQQVKVLGMHTHAASFKKIVNSIESMIIRRKGAYICVSNVHMCMEVYDNKTFSKVVNSADLVVADGRPIFWAQKLLGQSEAQQIRGQDLMIELCKVSSTKGIRLGLYGGNSIDVLELVKNNLSKKYSNIQIVYSYSPPFRPLSEEEDKAQIKAINALEVDVLFVGIGCPKQESWMAAHKHSLDCVMIGVGAAFDFIAGEKKHAPVWLQKAGLEWLFRLACEPRRLFKRYFRQNPRFLYYFVRQLLNKNKK